jgi:hypothetical protein
MQITLLVRVEGDGDLSLWQRRVDRPYPSVPCAGDSVYLAEDAHGEGVAPRTVADVAWENDGTVALSFDLVSDQRSAAEQLEGLGFVPL